MKIQKCKAKDSPPIGLLLGVKTTPRMAASLATSAELAYEYDSDWLDVIYAKLTASASYLLHSGATF